MSRCRCGHYNLTCPERTIKLKVYHCSNIQKRLMHKLFIKLWPLKIRVLLFALFLTVLLNAHYYSDFQTNLLSGVYIQDGSSDLKANYWSVPLVFDWDNDGKKDLLVGNSFRDENGRNYGHIHFYKNTGTDAAPSFSGHTLIHTCTDICSPVNAAAVG
jgi:hypothetical protein